MCSNYDPVTDNDRLLASFGVGLPDDSATAPPQAGLVMAPFIVRTEIMSPDVPGLVKMGLHGLLPAGAPDVSATQHNRTCPSERMKSMPTFRQSWWAGQRCLVPAEMLRAWCYESGRPEMWGIQRQDGDPLALAGLWNEGTAPDGARRPSFTLLTVDAHGHPVFERMNAPAAEKRMPVILTASAQQVWLYGSLKDAERALGRFPPEALVAAPQEAPTRPRREPRSWAATPDMFAFEWHMTAVELPAKQATRAPRTLASRPSPDAQGPTTHSLF